MSDHSDDRTASLMTPAKLAQLKVRPKPAASPAVWLDQLAADAGSGHVRRLVDLCRQLEAQLRGLDAAAVASACGPLQEASAALDFASVQPRGWLARATGKGKEAVAGFVAQHERMLRAGEDLGDALRALQKAQPARAAIERTLVEFEVEVRQIEKIMDQGARWLQDMRNQLKTREAAGGDAALRGQIAEDTARCELLVARLKQLRASSGATQQVTQRCQQVGSRHASLAAAVQALLEGEWKACRKACTAVADEAVASGSASDGVDAARRARDALHSALQHAREEAGAAQSQDQALAAEVAALHTQLRTAA